MLDQAEQLRKLVKKVKKIMKQIIRKDLSYLQLLLEKEV